MDQQQQDVQERRGEERETDYLISSNTRPQSQNRRPYYYSPYGLVEDVNTSTAINSNSMDTWSERANYSRYLFYSRLRRETLDPGNELLLIPPHVVPPGFYYPPFLKTSDGKQNSIVTIFTVWNTMTGTSMLSMPWAMERAGLIPAVVLLIGMAAISFYTAYRILEVFENNESSKIQDFAVLCKRLLGRWSQILALIFSVLTLLGATIVYWVLMSNFLYHTVDFLHSAITSDSPSFSSNASEIYCPDNVTMIQGADETDTFHKIWDLHRTVPLLLILILGPIICVRSPTFFSKFNSLGTLSIVYIMVFMFVKLGKHGLNISLSDINSPSYIPLYKPNFPALGGLLGLSYFIHNCITTIMRNNRNQRNNKRDLGISFLFVALTYFLIGGLFYIIFPLDKACIQDNFLNNFRSFDAWTFAARIFLFFQILTVYPLLVYILRVQLVYSITKQEPTILQTLGSNVVVVGICISFAIWLPQIGTIIRFTGAACGLVYSFFLPVALYLVWQRNLNSLSKKNIVLHGILFSLGLANFIAQFLVSP
ncbi:sodium-coupled neutral amino acid transporter 9 homolog isoform X1 [Folsomia candida]|uniref:sodium-coupled neutral amino acid transporter 9 homolog isoform X1 n=1 Tax=Folsomia candida TaxID=158441 RepID=UPI000B903924|nr:sodium-coupled neutral amino acid transporter 9 homolog isoform X1 [Folsomia candida]XP_021950183.1 sodium-coupled neutral amino acid transporter 9 homolog isoform X1 [Folsomia candida]XP_035705442.1 sodium-coupled neutral amino acid transporter 9 homolog isoform X1 [Folsomia candida]